MHEVRWGIMSVLFAQEDETHIQNLPYKALLSYTGNASGMELTIKRTFRMQETESRTV